MSDTKDPSIIFTAREWAMHQAGVTQGTGTGMKAVVDQLRQSLLQSVDTARKQVEASEDETDAPAQSLKAFEAWVDGFKPWMDMMMAEADKHIQESNARVEQIGPAPRNLRNRLVNAIMAARTELSKR